MAQTVVPVTERALVQRINRQLTKKGQMLKAARGRGAKEEVGYWYLVDTERNILLSHHCNVVEVAKELDVIYPWESLED